MAETAETKMWYQSKIVWLNVITTVIAVLTLLGAGTLSFMTPQTVELTLLAVAILNIILRVWFTDTAVTLTKSSKS